MSKDQNEAYPPDCDEAEIELLPPERIAAVPCNLGNGKWKRSTWQNHDSEGSTKLLQTRDLQNPTEFLTPWVFVDKLLECLLFDTADTSTDRSDLPGKANYACHLY